MRNLTQYIKEKLNSHQQTPANNAEPKMSIKISRARTTVMDSDYWTVETIRQKPGLGDISVAPRRYKPYGPPNRIYEIHIDNGQVITAIREYPDKLEDGWKDQFSLGEGSSVAIAFDGDWYKYRRNWRLITDEKPWLLWVDGNGKLQAQLWDEVTTKQELSTGVKFCKAIRAWKNVNFADQNQGIVVAYIKIDGTVWYRNYCTQADDTTIWENERQLIAFTGMAVSLNLFITNDYRVGFIIEDHLGKVYWYITERNWAGMAIAPEYIKANISDSKIVCQEIDKIKAYEKEYIDANITGTDVQILYAMADNSFRSAKNFDITMQNEELEDYQDWGYRIAVVTQHDMTALDNSDFDLVDANSIAFSVQKIIKTSRNHYTIKTSNMNNASGDLTLSFITGDTKGEAGQDMGNFSIVFTPTNFVPIFIPLAEVEATWNE